MSKNITAKTGTYTKDGQEKGKYTKIGAIITNQNGKFILIDPTVSLAGVLQKQNAMAAKEGKPPRDNVMCSIFDNSQGNQQQNRQPQQQQQPQQQADYSEDIPF